jgi:putative ABC transport system permease protein
MLRRSPGFTAVAVLTLALGTGMTTAVFSVVNSILLRSIDCPNPDRLAWIGNYNAFAQHDMIALADFYEWRALVTSFSALTAYSYQTAAVVAPGAAVQLEGVLIGGDFWSLTGAKPAMGRLFTPEEHDAVVLTWEAFQNEFAGNPAMLGASVTIDGRAATVSGVLPAGFQFQFPAWWQAASARPIEAYLTMPANVRQSLRSGQVVAALRPGVTLAQAQAELVAVQQRLIAARPNPSPRSDHLRVRALREQLVGGVRTALLVLFGAGLLVLLMACVNIAGLLLSRAASRQREIAIRAAIGAGRWRVLRQLLVESLVLAGSGAAAGLLLARWAIAILLKIFPQALSGLANAPIDARVLAFAAAISIGAAILFGTGPALTLWRTNLRDALKDGGRTSASLSGMRIRKLLVAGEFALALVLLSGSGLLVKSFWRMNALTPGFEPRSVLTMKVRLTGPAYEAPGAQNRYLTELLQRAESLPGVQAAGISNWFFFAGAISFPSDAGPARQRTIRQNACSPGYLKTLGVRLVKGRWFTDVETTRVVLLNESMAREAFAAADPIGRQLSIPRPVTVIGVVSDLKYSKLDADPPAEVYFRYQDFPMNRNVDFAARTTSDPRTLAAVLRQSISQIDRAQPVFGVRTLEEALADSIAPRRFNLFLLGAFAAAALLLALVGIYGVINRSVAERTHEIGVRMALGSQRTQVVGLIVYDALAITAIGTAAGLAATFALTRLMRSLLYAVSPNDPATFAIVAAALIAMALTASSVPALRAARIDPIAALRYE